MEIVKLPASGTRISTTTTTTTTTTILQAPPSPLIQLYILSPSDSSPPDKSQIQFERLCEYSASLDRCASPVPAHPRTAHSHMAAAYMRLTCRAIKLSGCQAAPLLALILVLICTSSAHAARSSPSSSTLAAGPLLYNFYKHSCPHAESIVHGVVKEAVAREARMAGSLLRLHFHDCFVQGCDGSVLLKSIPGVLEGEQEAFPNNNSLRGFDVINDIKAALEQQCPGVVSCADMLALAARDSVVVSGGPSYGILLGRRDSLSATRSLANQMLPSFKSNVSALVANFAAVGLTASDMVVLSGGHTIGKANCATFADRIPPSANDSAALASSYSDLLSLQCPTGASSGALVNLDVASPTHFDNHYYTNLLQNRGLLHSDQVLYSTPGATHDQVARYAAHQRSFFADFALAMVKMGNISPLTGSQGQVRAHCGYANSVVSTR